ncbi:MAG: hypothetical protein JO356_20230 [Acidobacteria bacterium]|nr:hypothetical protein [Acidobacteriota bacterium]
MSFATDWQSPATQLAQKISSETGPTVVTLEVNNRSSLDVAAIEEIRRTLISSLAASGVRVGQTEPAASTIRVTVSENLTHYVWVAEVGSDRSAAKLIFVSITRPDSALLEENMPPLTLHLTALIAQDTPILDVASLGDGPSRLLVLGTSGIAIYEMKDGRATPSQSLALGLENPLPRDPRGRLIVHKDRQYDAYLPGVICHGTASAGLSISCSSREDPWPLGGGEDGIFGFFSPARNFFTGALIPGLGKQKSAPPFYSAARIAQGDYGLWILAGLDGRLHLLDGISEQILAQVRWGSEIAGVHAACRSDWQILATAPENEAEDSVLAFAFHDREPMPVSQKLTFKGTIRALWPTKGGGAAIAVYRNPETGRYEAVELNLNCSH